MTLLAASSFLGGIAEAAFLVVITRTALAIADGKDSFGILAGRTASVAAALAVAAVILAVRLILSLVAVRASTALSVQVLTRSRRRLADAFLRTSWATQQAEPSGRLQELLMSFAATASGVAVAFGGALNAVLNLAALILASLLINPLATLMVVAVLAALGTVLAPIRLRIRLRSASAARAQMSFATAVSEVGGLGLEMQAFGVRDQFSDRVGRLIGLDAVARRKALVMQGALAPLYTFLAYSAVLLGLAVAATFEAGEIGGIAAVMLVMLRSLGYGQAFQAAIGNLTASLPYLDTLDDTAERYIGQRATGGDVVIDGIGAIDAVDVSFAYQPAVEVLHNLDFRIEFGEVLGVIGPSGSGKTTLIQLLLGLRDPTSGRLLVDGVDLRHIDRRSWTSRVAFVPQDASLMSGTVAENIAFFRDIEPEAIRRAAAQAHIATEIEAMRDGYDTQLGTHGSQLSGGQRQRVSIARALAGAPELLLMDEPTSALDVRSEALIRQTIVELKGRVTVVIIAHRLSTLEACDRIMIIQDGELKALDTPASLSHNNEFFRESLALSGIVT